MQLIKRLTQTLSAGSTSLTFTDSMINNNSVIEVYADSIEVYPTALSQSGTSVTAQFDAQLENHSILLLINNIVSLSDPELATLLDVDLSTLSDDDILTYDISTDKWINTGANHDIKEYEQTGFLSRNLMKATESGYNINGLTFVKNDDGSYTVNGRATARTFQRVALLADCGLKNGKQYRLTGVPITDNNYAVGIDSIGRGNPFYNFTNDTSLTNAYVYIMVENGATCDNMVFKPMITSNMAAQYDDFTPYAKSNIELGSEINSIRNYSTNETVIGKWINSETIYRKVIDCGNLPNNTTKAVAHGISDLDVITNWSGTCYSTINSGYSRPMPLADPTAANMIRIDVSGGNVNIKTASDWSSYKGYVTLEYTKSTD